MPLLPFYGQNACPADLDLSTNTLYDSCVVLIFLTLNIAGCGEGNRAKKLIKTEDNNFIYGDSESEMFYEITQLPFPTFWGGEAYSIMTSDGDLYLIDGGFQGEDGQRITQYIEEHGGKVMGWILTHPHVDHIGAFLDYMAVNSENVETVYYSPFTREFFEEEEDPAVYEVLNNPNAILFYQFIDMMEKTSDNTEYIPMMTGDKLNIGELEVECFASFDPDRHDVNANSLVFTISYNEFALLLFCASELLIMLFSSIISPCSSVIVSFEDSSSISIFVSSSCSSSSLEFS